MESCERLVFRIVEAARAVHLALGPGFIESIYSRALIAELKWFSSGAGEGDQGLVRLERSWKAPSGPGRRRYCHR